MISESNFLSFIMLQISDNSSNILLYFILVNRKGPNQSTTIEK